MNGTMKRLPALLACCAVGLAAIEAEATYPDHPVHLALGFAPGGGTDVLARLLGQKLSEKWGQPVVIENRPGADTTIAADYVAHAAPDGYTAFFATNAITIPLDYKLNFDLVKSFEPVTLAASQPDVLVSNPTSLPAQSLKEMMTTAKARPGQLNFGSSGTGTNPYLEWALFKSLAKLDIVTITYKGTGPTVVALLGGEVQLMFGTAPALLENVKSGKIRPLAVSTKFRSPVMPDVPTIAEAADLPEYDGGGSEYGIMLPAGTPKEVVNKMHDDLVEIMHLPDVKKTMTDQGFLTIANTPEEFGAMFAKETEKWAAVSKAINGK